MSTTNSKYPMNPTAAETKKELYDRWVKEVCAFLKEVGPKLNRCCSAMQSRPVLDKSPEVVFLGHHPHEDFGWIPEKEADRKRFDEGNPQFYADNGKERMKWPIWAKLYDVMKFDNYTRPMEDGNFVFMNAVYFGAAKIKQLLEIPGSHEAMAQCIRFTGQAISDIFQPKVVVCLSVNHIFEKLNREFHFQNIETLQLKNGEHVLKKVVKRGQWGNSTVIGVPNPTSWGMSWLDLGAIALFIKQELEKK